MPDASPNALVLLFDGFEEIEALTPIDLLSRAGVALTLANLDGNKTATGRSDIIVQTPQAFETLEMQNFDCLILPGGPGIASLRNHPKLCQNLRDFYQRKVTLACICAAPLLLLDAGILPGLAYTCHPSAEKELLDSKKQAVVFDQNCITSRGAGTAISFSLALLEHLVDKATAQKIARAISYCE